MSSRGLAFVFVLLTRLQKLTLSQSSKAENKEYQLPGFQSFTPNFKHHTQ